MNLDLLVYWLKRDEGWRARLYDDANDAVIGPGVTVQGHPTIGYGFNFGIEGDELTLAEGDFLLRNRGVRAMQEAAQLVPNWLLIDDVRQAVVADMAYNLGKTGLAGFPKFLAAVDARDYPLAASEMENSRWFSQVGDRGRRLAEAMRSGVA